MPVLENLYNIASGMKLENASKNFELVLNQM